MGAYSYIFKNQVLVDFWDYILGFALFSQYSKPPSEGRLRDFSGVFVLGVATFFFFWFFTSIFSKIGKYLLIRNKGQEFYELNKIRVKHFQDRGASMAFHAMTSVLCYYFFRNEFWWFHNSNVLSCVFAFHVKYPFALKLYYNVETGMYIFKTLELFIKFFVLKKKVKDFNEMAIHHFISLALLFISFFVGYVYFGILVLFVHNACDVFTYLCRMSNDVKWNAVTAWIFPVAILSWIFFRLYLLPYYIITPGWLGYMYPYDHPYFMGNAQILLLCALYTMHCYWLYGMLRIVHGIMTQGYDSKLDIQYIQQKEERDMKV